jgi:hypothetical protein
MQPEDWLDLSSSPPPGNWGGVKEGSIFGQVKYLMRFCVRKLTDFLGFYLTNSEKLDMKNYLKCRHLHFQEHLKSTTSTQKNET